MTNILNRAVVTIAALTLFAAANQAEANEVVTIQLKNGKSFAAKLDPRTDDDRLWLQIGNGSTTLRRAVEWKDVRVIKHDRQSVSSDDAKTLAATHDSVSTSDSDRARQLLGFTPRIAQR